MKSKFSLLIATCLIMLLVTATALAGARYVGNKRSKKLHDTTHSTYRNYIKQMASRNKKSFQSEAQANRAGYHLCKPCY